MKTSIGKKLLLGFLSILIILIAVISLNFYQLAKVQHTYDDLIDDKVAKLIKIKELHVSIEAEQNAVRGYVATKNDVEIQKFTDAHETYQQLSSELNKIIKKNEALAILQEIDQIESDYFELGNKEIEVTRQNKQVEFEDMVARGGQTIEQFNQKIGELTSYQQKLLDNGHQETAKTVAQIKQTMLSLGILAILLGIAVALFMGRLISRPLVSMAKAAKKIANGDLTEKAIDVKSKDEIGQLAASFNQMSHNLRQLLQQIELNAEHVAASSEELTASADQSSKASEQITITMQELAQGIEKEVQSVEETSRTMNEISMSVQQIAASAQNVSASSMDTSEKASDGGKVIYNAIEQMNSINQTVQLLAESIKSLGERSNEIGNITSVISEISAQTNLLALNAAIEAARAGEHGRGFAVVAGEVGKLAALSAQSAEQISALITSIQEETEKSILSMEGAVKEVSSGIKIAHDAGDSFTHIEGSINEVTMQIQEISAAVQQLAAGSEQIVQSMEFVKRIAEEAAAGTQEVSASTEEQLASMEEISASAHSLSKMAEELQKTIGQFNI